MHQTGGVRPQIGEAAVVKQTPQVSAATADEANRAFRRLFIIAAAISSLAFLLALRVPDNRLDGPPRT